MQQPQSRAFCASVNKAILVGMLLVNLNPVQGRDALKTVSLENAIREFPAFPNMAVRGLAFYKANLYAGSPIGLLEISNAWVNRVYRGDEVGSSVIFPCQDAANGLLWAQVYGTHQLAYYDGKIWRTISKPKPKHGYVSRGDVWEGFRFVSDPKTVYWQGGGRAWGWHSPKWVEVDYPPTTSNKNNPLGLVDRLIATDDHLYFIMRDEKQSLRVWLELEESWGIDRIIGNSVYYFADSHWNLITNKTIKFLSQDTAAANNKGYVRTTKGDLLEVTEGGIVKLDTPGICEAIATSPTGILLASFRRQGVFELKDQWHKLLANPYPDSEEDYEVCLTAGGQVIALSIAPRSGIPNANTRIAIWISERHEWRPVLFH